jgi:hypothetical protein
MVDWRLPRHPSGLPVERALRSKEAGHRVRFDLEGHSFNSRSVSTISTICDTVSRRFQARVLRGDQVLANLIADRCTGHCPSFTSLVNLRPLACASAVVSGVLMGPIVQPRAGDRILEIP